MGDLRSHLGIARPSRWAMMGAVSSISVEVTDHIAVVTLDRPPVNAVDAATFDEIRDAFNVFNDDRDVRVALFTAVGERAFMAGVDLRSIGERPADPPASRLTGPAAG